MQDYESGQGLSDEENVDMAHLALFSDRDPLTYEDAVKSSKWRQAMDAKVEAIVKNDTWELTELPYGVKTIGVKWIFKTKLNEHGEVDKYKARLVAKEPTVWSGLCQGVCTNSSFGYHSSGHLACCPES